jgi:hypothetical protein
MPSLKAALHAEVFPDRRRHQRIGDHLLPQGRIGGGQHHRKDGHLHELEIGKQDGSHHDPQQDRQRQAERQQPNGQAGVPPQHGQVGVGGVSEQDQGQGELGDHLQVLRCGPDAQPAQDGRAQQHSQNEEHEGTGQGRTPQPCRNETVEIDNDGDDRQVEIAILHCCMANLPASSPEL